MDYINFNTPARAYTPSTSVARLPTITDAVFIDGWSQPGYGSSPVIELNGGKPEWLEGLTLGAGSDGSTIRGLVINRFSTGIGSAVRTNTIQGNWIGLDNTGMIASANGAKGIYATSSSGILIGTDADGNSDANERNVISGNAERHLFRQCRQQHDRRQLHRYRRSPAPATSPAPASMRRSQAFTWVMIRTAMSSAGPPGAQPPLGEQIHYGFEVLNSTSQNNLLQGNFIGTDVSGLVALGNTDGGASFWGASSGNVFGGSAIRAGNVIAGNWRGVLVGNGTTSATPRAI